MPKIMGQIELGVQSFCFRHFTNEQIAGFLEDCGLNMLEICKKHMNLKVESEGKRVLEFYQDRSVSFNSFGISSLENDEAGVRPYFEFAREAGISILGVKPSLDSIDLLGRLCDEYGVKLAIHNHGRKDEQYGTIRQLEAILEHASDSIGICLDTGWMIDAGEDPVEAIHRFSQRIHGVHFKDFHYDSAGERSEAILGEGRVDLSGVLNALKQHEFSGYASIEYEGDTHNPVPNISKCVEALLDADRRN